MGVILSIVALLATYWVARRSLVLGILCAIGFGYIFGITRANISDTASFFIFDSAVLGLYAAQSRQITAQFFTRDAQRLKHWVVFLMLWSLLLFLVPLQDPMVQLVGLRGNIFLLPFILIGARLESDQMYEIGFWLAIFNLVAFTVGVAEFAFGVEHFFPHNAVTELIYRSKDAGANSYRIPSLFANAHSFGGMMAVSLPWIAGAWLQQHRKIWHRNVMLAGMIAAVIGVFMSAARVHFVAMVVVVGAFTFSARLRPIYRVGWIAALVAVTYVVASNPRMQRFQTLYDTQYVTERVQSSVNVNLLEAVVEYPFGVGLGGGGTSIPYFLEGKVNRPVLVESEIGRIHLETGIIGLAAWLGFMLWIFTRPRTQHADPLFLGTRMAWFCCLSFFAMGLIGIGLFTAIPSSAVLLMSLGWIATRHTRQMVRCSAAVPSVLRNRMSSLRDSDVCSTCAPALTCRSMECRACGARNHIVIPPHLPKHEFCNNLQRLALQFNGHKFVNAPWVLVCGGFHRHGGMDRANYALALKLLEQGRTVHLVSHQIAPELASHPSVRLNLVRRPLNSILLGEHALRQKGLQVACAITEHFPNARVVVNGGNCNWADVNWVHAVHSCWPRFDSEAPAWFRTKYALTKRKARRDERNAFRVAKLLIANSERTRNDLIAIDVPQDRIRTVYLGTDPYSSEGTAQRQRARNRFAIPAEAKVIAFVGALGYDRRKGFDILLASIQQLALPDIYVIAAGGGRGLERWRAAVQRAKLSDRIRLIGFTEQIEDVYSACDLLVSPVRYESFGLNVQEAICRGVPSIVSASAGVAELYPPQLRHYLLETPEDTCKLAEMIRLWHSDPDVARRAFEPFSSKLRRRSWSDMAEEIIALVETDCYSGWQPRMQSS